MPRRQKPPKTPKEAPEIWQEVKTAKNRRASKWAGKTKNKRKAGW